MASRRLPATGPGLAGILIGTSVGAHHNTRALRVAWIGTLVAGLTAETIGLAAACWPGVWLSTFTRDPVALATGSTYLRMVGPFFGFFGVGVCPVLRRSRHKPNAVAGHGGACPRRDSH